MGLDNYLLYLAALAVFFATPPDTSQLLIISNSIRHDVKRCRWIIAGDLCANCLQMTAAAFGLAAIIASSALAFTVIKWVGVLYLAWIGLKLLFSTESPSNAQQNHSANRLSMFKQGFFTSLANPFAVAFFAALFPQFINTDSAVLPQLLVLGVTYIIVDGAILLSWGTAASQASKRVKRLQLSMMNKVSGALMIAAAGLLAAKGVDTAES